MTLNEIYPFTIESYDSFFKSLFVSYLNQLREYGYTEADYTKIPFNSHFCKRLLKAHILKQTLKHQIKVKSIFIYSENAILEYLRAMICYEDICVKVMKTINSAVDIYIKTFPHLMTKETIGVKNMIEKDLYDYLFQNVKNSKDLNYSSIKKFYKRNKIKFLLSKPL